MREEEGIQNSESRIQNPEWLRLLNHSRFLPSYGFGLKTTQCSNRRSHSGFWILDSLPTNKDSDEGRGRNPESRIQNPESGMASPIEPFSIPSFIRIRSKDYAMLQWAKPFRILDSGFRILDSLPFPSLPTNKVNTQ